MSWMIKKIGEREAVRAEIDKETNLPPAVKQCFLSVLQPEENVPNGVRVEGFGRTNIGKDHYSSIGKLEVEPFQLTE